MIIKNILFLFSLFFCILFTYSVFAENKSNKLKTELKVEADESLEWFEKEKYYLAKGNVILTKDGLRLYASKVRANYKEENDENVLKMIIANGNVVLTKGKIKAYIFIIYCPRVCVDIRYLYCVFEIHLRSGQFYLGLTTGPGGYTVQIYKCHVWQICGPCNHDMI